MRANQSPNNPFPMTATVYTRDASFVVGLLSFGSLYSLAEMTEVEWIVFHRISRATDSEDGVAQITANLLKHLDVCLRVKGHRLIGHDLELTQSHYDLRVRIESEVQAA